ncbi:calcium-binding protein [Herbaspirillum seropedicae]|uniref:calcium-binding protein n=1 Tax=Herbaspirillum seropedicae TaxID=964 RepID=UPI001FD072E9|nr:calcium-binding protein [Herbaspirillum seropedicae]
MATPVPIAGSTPANTERYLDAFNAPAPFGDGDAIQRKGQTASSGQKVRLAIDTPDLVMGAANLTGIGNALANHLTGNIQNNILDGMGGADIMAGGKGDDSYYMDNAGDQIIEQAGEGLDTVYAKVSTTLAANVENLVLLDAGKPQSAVVNGVNVLIYGYPGSYQLDYDQGNAVPGFEGTCGETSVANVTMLGDQPVSEKEVVERAIKEGLCDTDSQFSGFRGGSSQWDQQQLLEEFGFTSKVTNGFNAQEIARDIKAGKGVTVSVYADALWGDGAMPAGVSTDHRITVTGVACSAATGAIAGFYIADSGRGRASDMCRFVTLDQMRKVTSAMGANTITTDDPIKMRKQDINATGNELDNILVGNRGNNVITGGKGNDLLIGGAGNDTYAFAKGDGQDVLYDHDAARDNLDTLKFTDAKQTNLWFSKAGNDLRIDVLGSTDQVLVKDWYAGGASGSDNHLERIKTADGKTLYDTDVDKLVQAMASFAPPSATQTSWPTTQSDNGKVLLTISH